MTYHLTSYLAAMISYDEFANVLIIKSGKSVYC